MDQFVIFHNSIREIKSLAFFLVFYLIYDMHVQRFTNSTQ